ncbi:site-specific integrase [Chryseobacterium sp. JUb7]|uniref:site-specific integrase n=1 Tax=Chryseobacterium sp. JUb7 TaxID=2940599 RepID=UPI00216A8DC9|nr:site-specific integrase [Chryseobacterium sp. JUb7]MCS3530006.1 site-specific recombinase XerD [Chryseobacterium sp. JUb7]
MTDFAKHLENFFIKYLIGECNSSKHTIRAYRDAFTLLLIFMKDEKNINADNLQLKHLNRNVVLDFLQWLEYEHRNEISTRNQRYAAIKSFCKYLQYEEPMRISEWQNIRSIRLKKDKSGSFSYLSIDAIKLLLDQVPLNSRSSRRDLALLALLYDSGARVQEIADLTPDSIRFDNPNTIRLVGKGNKQRIVPLQKEQTDLLKNYIQDFGLNKFGREKSPLFSNRIGEKLTTAGITYILKKYALSARLQNEDLIPSKISPHIIRHSKAMHLLQGGVNLVYIRDFLGHKSIQTTEIYARADSKQKREALESVYVNVLPESNTERSWEKNPKLKDFLKSLS